MFFNKLSSNAVVITLALRIVDELYQGIRNIGVAIFGLEGIDPSTLCSARFRLGLSCGLG